MTGCDDAREHLSATLDGEAGEPSLDVARHLAACGSCAEWLDAATAVNRGVRIEVADVPDLTETLLVGYRDTVGARESGHGLRWGLALVALAQLAIAVPALFGSDLGAPAHVARELGSWDIALAVGFLYAARRPARAAGLVPLVGTLVALLVLTSALDVGAGRTATVTELPHMLAVVGLVLLRLVSGPVRAFRSFRRRAA
jgi:predicted anti-sigma-YlaC factor YlaD